MDKLTGVGHAQVVNAPNVGSSNGTMTIPAQDQQLVHQESDLVVVELDQGGSQDRPLAVCPLLHDGLVEEAKVGRMF